MTKSQPYYDTEHQRPDVPKLYLRIGRVFKLLKHVAIRRVVQQLRDFIKNPVDALSRVCDVHVGSKSSEQNSSFDAVISWHDYFNLVALDCSDECQPNAGVPTSSLDKDRLLPQSLFTQGRINMLAQSTYTCQKSTTVTAWSHHRNSKEGQLTFPGVIRPFSSAS